jgi:hypothetical protein
MVTANLAEGALTEPATDLVDTVPMPDPIREAVAAFVAEHHVEQVFVKQTRPRRPAGAGALHCPERAANE